MKILLFVLAIGTAILIFVDLDNFIEKVNDFKNPTFNISILHPSLRQDGVLTLDVLLENVTDSPLFVDRLELTYIVLLESKNYKKMNRNILVEKNIDKKSELPVSVMLPDFYKPEIASESSSWDRNKQKKFGLRIFVKDNSDNTIKRAKRNIDI